MRLFYQIYPKYSNRQVSGNSSRSTAVFQLQYNLNGSNPNGSFTMDDSNSFFSPYKILPIAQENKYLGIFFLFYQGLYVVCTHHSFSIFRSLSNQRMPTHSAIFRSLSIHRLLTHSSVYRSLAIHRMPSQSAVLDICHPTECPPIQQFIDLCLSAMPTKQFLDPCLSTDCPLIQQFLDLCLSTEYPLTQQFLDLYLSTECPLIQ